MKIQNKADFVPKELSLWPLSFSVDNNEKDPTLILRVCHSLQSSSVVP